MVTGTTEAILAGIKYEIIDGKRVLYSVFLTDVENGTCVEHLIAEDRGIDKEKLAIELIENYRKEITGIIDVKDDYRRPEGYYYITKFVGIKNIE